jgi:hypothetical protein
MLCSQAAKGVLAFCVRGVFLPHCPAVGVLPLAPQVFFWEGLWLVCRAGFL